VQPGADVRRAISGAWGTDSAACRLVRNREEGTPIDCEKCGGAIYVDREAVLQVERQGLRGGRVFCFAGCTDVWLIDAARTTGRAVKPPDGRGKYPRTVRTVSCRVCERHYQTRGTKPGRCKACRATRDRLRRRSSIPRGGGDRKARAAPLTGASGDGGVTIPFFDGSDATSAARRQLP